MQTLLLDSILLVLAPIPYLLVGVAFLTIVKARPERFWLSPLLGCVLVGWFAELGFVTGISSKAAVITAIVLSLFTVIRMPVWRTHLRVFSRYYLLYFACAGFLLINPYPALGHFSGDWFGHFKMGQAIFNGVFPIDLLERPPLYGAASLPLWLLKDGVVPFQIFSAVMSAGAVLVLYYACEAFKKKHLPLTWMLLIVLSPQFLLHLVTLWPKFMVTACLVTATVEAVRYRKHGIQADFVWASFWFGLALAVHHTSITYIPLLAAIAWFKPPHRYGMVKNLLLVTVMTTMLAGLFEFWVFAEYGIAERINRNPTIVYRNAGQSFATEVFFSNFAGWGAHMDVWRAWTAPQMGNSILGILSKGYFTLSIWVTYLSGTFLGIFLPLILATNRKLIPLVKKEMKNPLFWPIVLTSIIPIFVQAAIQPQYTPLGAVQCGLIALTLMLFLWLGIRLVEQGSLDIIKKAFAWTVFLGTVPYTIMQFSVLMSISLPEKYSAPLINILIREDSDAGIIYQNGFSTLGTEMFPLGILSLVLLGLFIFKHLRSQKQPETLKLKQAA